MVGGPAHASAVSPQIDQRTCSPNDPTPQIEFYGTNVQYCYGGTVGTILVNKYAFTMHSGGYYGNVDYVGADGKDHKIPFRPNEVHGLGGNNWVYQLTITPPF